MLCSPWIQPWGRSPATPGPGVPLQTPFSSHFPGVPLDGNGHEAAVMSVRTMLDYVPGASDKLKDDLSSALTSASQGADA